MRESACDELLAWALPQLGLRWRAFRRVQGQVRKRVRARIAELGLADARAYAEYLRGHADEWAVLEASCGITISRFYRDRTVFDCLAQRVIPALAARLGPDEPLCVWSAGCASGEEAYTIALLWELQLSAAHPGHALSVLATDSNPRLLERAAEACYRKSSLRELPEAWVARGFTERDDLWCLEPNLRRSVRFECQDLRRTLPPQRFELILCRNLAFSYFERQEQRRVLHELIQRLRPGGYLVIGLHEQLPDSSELRPVPECDLIFQYQRDR